MKNLLLILLLSISAFAFSQNYQGYVPFPTAAIWIESSNHVSPNLPPKCIVNEYRIINDTLINGALYHKIEKTEIDQTTQIGCGPPWNAQITKSIFGYIRNDSANKKVWLRFPNSNQDTLFYDFDLCVGDTIWSGDFYMSPGMWTVNYVRVDTIDTVYIGNQYRKKFIVSKPCHGFEYYYIEGVGASTGFALDIASTCLLAGSRNELLCVGDSSGSFYPDTIGGCQLTTNLDEFNMNQISFQLYPNPTAGTINLRTTETLQSIEIYNLQGQKVQKINPKERSWELPKQSGLYLMRLQDEQGNVYSEKVIRN
jgi:hypothetical protein